MQQAEKREVPSAIRKLLAVDAYLTDVFVKYMERLLPFQQLKRYYSALEISCHGVPWFASVLAFIWILNSKNLYQMQVNLLLGFTIDITFVAILKASTRRRRPAFNDDPFAIGPDKYSFPSGHASRSTFILYFFLYLWPVSSVFVPPLFLWVAAICLSRILMRRHHILDIIAGVAVGILEAMLLGYIYLETETCVNLISWITDEKVDGPEYDV